MAEGKGKYDDACTVLREATNAAGAVIVVIDGIHGSGFSCQASPERTAELPEMLELLAKQIREDLKNAHH